MFLVISNYGNTDSSVGGLDMFTSAVSHGDTSDAMNHLGNRQTPTQRATSTWESLGGEENRGKDAPSLELNQVAIDGIIAVDGSARNDKKHRAADDSLAL